MEKQYRTFAACNDDAAQSILAALHQEGFQGHARGSEVRILISHLVEADHAAIDSILAQSPRIEDAIPSAE